MRGHSHAYNVKPKKSQNMDERDVMMAKYIKDSILPKVQEMQRVLYFDKNINVEIDGVMVYGGLHTTLLVKDDKFSVYGNILECTTFVFHTTKTKKELDRLLRGMCHFVKNWQERLG